MRLVAALAIVFLHVSFDPAASLSPMQVIRISARWCVPLFFMLTGFFLLARANGLPIIDRRRVGKMARITLVANLLFIPLVLPHMLAGRTGLHDLLTMQGVYFHLWFLSAMLAAFVALALLGTIRIGSRLLLGMCVGAILLLWFVDFYAQNDWYARVNWLRAARWMAALPLIVFGSMLPRIMERTSPKVDVTLLAVGFGLLVAEVVLSRALGIGIEQRQFPLGAFVMAASLIMVLARNPDQTACPRLAAWGRAYALPIYILHPAAIHFVAKALGRWMPIKLGPEASGLVVAPLAIVATVALIALAAWLLPWTIRILSGELPWLKPRSQPDK